MDDVTATLRISAAGMRAQGTRLRVIAENIANADSGPAGPGDLPYRRRVVTFRNALDRASDGETVRVRSIADDQTPFPRRWDPGHPAADSTGYVLESNVNALIEMTDLQEVLRSQSQRRAGDAGDAAGRHRGAALSGFHSAAGSGSRRPPAAA